MIIRGSIPTPPRACGAGRPCGGGERLSPGHEPGCGAGVPGRCLPGDEHGCAAREAALPGRDPVAVREWAAGGAVRLTRP